jgi:hypothetical protein
MLHLFRGLVGKGYGKDILIFAGIENEQFDEFYGKSECLTAACTGLIDC